jgi:phage terminase small subunit
MYYYDGLIVERPVKRSLFYVLILLLNLAYLLLRVGKVCIVFKDLWRSVVTQKQLRFINEYLIDLNATQACIRAGYSKKNANRIGSENLSKLDIKREIDKRMAEKEDSLIAKQNEVLAYLTSVLRGESESEVVLTELIGDGCSEIRHVTKRPDEKERLKAGELLAKRYGLLTDKIDGNVTVPIVLKDDVPDSD